MNVLERMKALCKENNISITKLENEMGYGNGSLAKAKNISGERVYEVAQYFGVSMEYLMGKENKKLADDSELSEAKQELIDFVKNLQEDAADSMLRMMKAYYEEWQRNQR